MDSETATKMAVKPVYDSLKDEVVGVGEVTNGKWRKNVVLKAAKYLNSKSVRKVTAKRAVVGTPTGQNKKGSALSKEHLFAVILYCDFSALCTAFSATFRLRDEFEDVESLKARHSQFGHFGRLLVELVLDFGINGYESKYNPSYQRGPFFCGLNCPLNIGSYAIRLNGPCSTSTQRSVAVNFAKSNGVILKLNNDNVHAEDQCFFDCSWISNYFEESERLWIAGKRALRIVSIAIVQNAKNYRKMIRAFYLFDAMISGVDMFECPLKEKQSDFDLLSDLIKFTLNESDGGFTDFDLYLKNEWKLFLQNKTEITVNLRWLNDYFQSLSKLVMFNVVRNGGYDAERGGLWSDTANGKDNVLRPEWISMFPSLHSVTIRTGGYGDLYKFRLEALLESMQSISPSVTVNVKDWGEWVESALADEISAAFDAAGWNIEYEKGDPDKRGDYPDNKLLIKSKAHCVVSVV